MKPRVKLDSGRTPGGTEMALYRRDDDFTIAVDGQALMQSREHESELALAQLGCAHLAGVEKPVVLIGGLGMGFTLRKALDMLSHGAIVVVAELMPIIVEWNRNHLGHLNDHPLDDGRVKVMTEDVAAVIRRSQNRFDAILLDVDNAPDAISDPGNDGLYSRAGILACRRALRRPGCLAVWSAGTSPPFEERLAASGMRAQRHRMPAATGGRSRSCVVWVASVA